MTSLSNKIDNSNKINNNEKEINKINDNNKNEIKLTAEQKARIENNRQKALLLKEKKRKCLTTNDLKILEIKEKVGNAYDSGAGFFIEEDEPSNKKFKKSETEIKSNLPEITTCELCLKSFDESFLKKHFDFSVCDICRDPKDKHTLITRTDAKTNYVLKDCDLDRREPPLRFISKRNPNQKFSRNDMKLYLQIQVERRALEVWGSEERLMNEIESRQEKKITRKEKEFKKNTLKLRMEMQSKFFKRKIADVHEHDYGEENYDEDKDEYFKECNTCDHIVYYEKM